MKELNIIKDCKKLYFKTKEAIKDSKDFQLNNHILRTVVSIGSNITEGSQRGKKEFNRFLTISQGSIAEFKFQYSLFEIENKEIDDIIDKITATVYKLRLSTAVGYRLTANEVSI